VTLKQKVGLFLKIQAATFVIGLAFIVREKAGHGVSLDVVYRQVMDGLFGGADPTHTRWLFLLPLFGMFLYFLRTDPRPRSLRQVFVKWSVLFLVMEFMTEWTKYGWTQATADLPVMLLRYAAGGALATAVWWLIERSPRTHPDSFYAGHGHGHAHGHASSTEPHKRGH